MKILVIVMVVCFSAGSASVFASAGGAQAALRDYCTMTVSGKDVPMPLDLEVTNANIKKEKEFSQTLTTKNGERFHVQIGRSAIFGPNEKGELIMHKDSPRSISIFVFDGTKDEENKRVIAHSYIIAPGMGGLQIYDSKGSGIAIYCGTREEEEKKEAEIVGAGAR